ncbi:hypothetical protein [Butyrivibrio proteoclasticus]|nr:hypothetical protein [Butyrivibrio proteoclasticus]
MQNNDLMKKTDSWNPENDLELAGILLTISAIAKRLAKLLLTNEASR